MRPTEVLTQSDEIPKRNKADLHCASKAPAISETRMQPPTSVGRSTTQTPPVSCALKYSFPSATHRRLAPQSEI